MTHTGQTFIIHIGQPKTGTTALQNALSRNADRLIEQGFVYPQVGGKRNHRILSLNSLGRLPRGVAPMFDGDEQKAIAASDDAWLHLGREQSAAVKNTIVLSCEFWFGASELHRLVEAIDRSFPNPHLHFVAYLRRPSEHYASFVQQGLRARSGILPPNSGALDDIDRFERYGDLTVRQFSPRTLIGRDIVLDFCHLIGCDPTGFDTVGRKDNTSLSAEGIVLLQEYRRRYHADREDVFTDDTKAFIRRLRVEEDRRPGMFTAPALRPEVAQWMDRETATTERLRAKFSIELTHDHGVKTPDHDPLAAITDSSQLYIVDLEKVEILRSAVMGGKRATMKRELR